MSTPVEWTTPTDLAGQVARVWAQGRILSARIGGGSLFPLSLRLRRPDAKLMAERFDEVRAWIRALEGGSRAQRGFGYDIEWTEINHRQLGRNRIPLRAAIPSERDALRLIGKEKDAERFQHLAAATMANFPVLTEWLARRPLSVLDHAADWERILAVLAWFRERPRSDLYLRQLDIRGVDTKFVEARKGLLAELLDLLLGPETSGQPSPGKTFEQRFGLRAKPPLIRFRLLDARLAIQGLSDISVPAAEFARLDPAVRRVFITENEVNGLAFPPVAHGLVVFGLGYGLDLLAAVDWLKGREIHYWGDVDTHGFVMLDRLRANFPATRSLLMDRETLLAHRPLWGREAMPYDEPLARLDGPEQALFDDLRGNRLGKNVRLEQERISFGWLCRALERVGASP